MTQNEKLNVTAVFPHDAGKLYNVLGKKMPASFGGEITEMLPVPCGISVTQVVVTENHYAVPAQKIYKILVTLTVLAHTVNKLDCRFYPRQGLIHIVCDTVCSV